MAVNFASAPTAIHNPMNRYNPYNGLSGPTPYSSNSHTPSTVSPTSPQISSASPSPSKHPAIARQIKPPKNPLYVPAVLRPTEAPSRHRSRKSSTTSLQRIIASTSSTPITPPSSAENSFDSKDGQRNMEETIQRRLLAGEGISRVVTDEWNDDVMEDVTGAPTRNHWKPDSSSPTCDAPICANPFTFIRRRHHCRRCGNIFCSTHSVYQVPLDQHARFHPQGITARACDNCWNDYVAWRRRRSERGSTSTSDGTASSGAATPIPGASRGHSRMSSSMAESKPKDPVVGSLSREWNWSTF